MRGEEHLLAIARGGSLSIACHLLIHHAVKLHKRKSQQIIEREN
jgi:hypothetical protein